MTDWRKSSHSGSQPETCVECACLASGRDGAVGIRDSVDPDGPRLILHPQAWRSLLTRLKQDASERTA
ncbi:DUF397 domain-containing protein [Actinomadura sp. B10D3]|uniref:DUF397 domain-containing protein n=1 Tax=Actinomadura sp. B10D3 TaxID=3153557 RepID=UPI00325DA930